MSRYSALTCFTSSSWTCSRPLDLQSIYSHPHCVATYLRQLWKLQALKEVLWLESESDTFQATGKLVYIWMLATSDLSFGLRRASRLQRPPEASGCHGHSWACLPANAYTNLAPRPASPRTASYSLASFYTVYDCDTTW